MTRLLYNLLFAIGLLVALFGVGVDYIMPGSSPGLNWPQALIIAAGALLALSAILLSRRGYLQRLKRSLRKHGLKALAISLLSLLILEIVLSLSGMPTYYPVRYSEEPLELVTWWTCEDQYCRFVQDATVDACENGILRGRACIVNRQGFGDSDDFTIETGFEGRTRILFLGDSFTQGYSADVGKSYVETVEKNFPQLVVWNAGIHATGTNQAMATFAELGPLLQPQLTILGFFANDFKDNLFPFDATVRIARADGTIDVIRNTMFDANGNLVRLPLIVSLLDYGAAGRLPIPGAFERLVGNSRLGSLLLELRDRLANITRAPEPFLRHQRSIELTRGHLSALRQQVEAQDSQLLVLMIDYREDMDLPKMRYEAAIELLHELEIPYLDTSPFVQAPDDFAPQQDIHWNNAGHQKVGKIVSDCIQTFIESGGLADCEYVTMPPGQG